MRKNYSEIIFTPAKLEEYFQQNDLKLTVSLLSNAFTTSIGRFQLLKEKSERLKGNTLSPIFGDKNLYLDIAKIHCEQLDLLANVFMFLEDFLVYSHNLNDSLKRLQEFPKNIVFENWNIAENEMKNLTNKKKSDIGKYLLFPEPDQMQLSGKEKRIVKSVLSRISKDTFTRIQNLNKFYENHRRVYMKYKHVLPAIIGLYQTSSSDGKPETKYISSHIYIMDHYKKKFATYVIGWNIETITYYEDVFMDIKTLFELLILSYLHYLMNLGNKSLIPMNTHVKAHELQKWKTILKKNNIIKELLPKYETKVNITGDLKKALLRKLAKDHIYRINRNILTRPIK